MVFYNLKALIKAIRATKTIADERALIVKESAVIRTSFKEEGEARCHRSTFVSAISQPAPFSTVARRPRLVQLAPIRAACQMERQRRKVAAEATPCFSMSAYEVGGRLSSTRHRRVALEWPLNRRRDA